MSDLLGTLQGSDPHPDTTEALPGPVTPPLPPANDFGTALPPGVHPLDQSVPLKSDGTPVSSDQPPIGDHLPAQGERRSKPWATENEEAFPINQRSAHDWTANRYQLQAGTPPIQLAGRLRGAVTTTIWLPASAPFGIVISPDQGDVAQGAGVQLNPGDSIDVASEGPVWGGVIAGNATGGPVQVIRTYNPPGGGLGLSSS